MESPFLIGFVLIVIGGVMEGVFSLPLKLTPRWEWENMWGSGSLMALILVPWPLAFLTVPSLGAVYGEVPVSTLALALLFGAGWGLGGIFFGLGLNAVGLSLGLSLIMGLIAIGGSLIPLLMQHPDQVLRPAGLVLIIGIAVMIVGLNSIAKAGRLKSAAVIAEGANPGDGKPTVPFSVGLMYCIAAGLLSALVNFGLIFGAPIAQAAERHGAAPSAANNAVWALVFTANYIVNAGYSLWLARRRKTFAKFTAPGSGPYWFAAVCMGLLWAGGIVVYGMGASRVGEFGAFLGFPVMLITSVLAGNMAGVATGEWRGAPRLAKQVMAGGVFLLGAAALVLAYSNQLIT